MRIVFGTDGVREKYPLLNELNSFILTYSFLKNLSKNLTQDLTNIYTDIYIGYDSRFSSLSIALSVASAIVSFFNKYNINKKVILSKSFTSTPLMAFISNYKRSYSIQITASHNPFFYNGIKIFDKSGKKIDPYLEKQIEDELNNLISFPIIQASDFLNFLNFGYQDFKDIDNNIEKFEFKDFSKFYVNKILKFFKDFYNKLQTLGLFKGLFKNVLVILDLGNSAISYLAPNVFNSFFKLINTNFTKVNFDLKVFNYKPNGFNINYKCGSVNYEVLKEKILEIISKESNKDYDLVVGFTYDGDADRTLAYLKSRSTDLLFFDGDLIILVLAYFLKNVGYDINSVALTHMSNLAIEEAFNKMGVKVIRVNVGDKYITQAIEEGKAQLGAENSGHIVIPLFLKTGDGLFTSLFFLFSILIYFEKIIELVLNIELYSQKLLNLKVPNKEKFIIENKELFNKLNEMIKMEGGRLFVRPSGTEDVVRILIEAKNKNIIDNIIEILNKEVILNV